MASTYRLSRLYFRLRVRKLGSFSFDKNKAGYLSKHVPVAKPLLANCWRGFESKFKCCLIATQAFLTGAASFSFPILWQSSFTLFAGFISAFLQAFVQIFDLLHQNMQFGCGLSLRM